MPAVLDPAALTLAERVAALEHVTSVCLIGSSARGDGDRGSDVDLLAVVDAKDHVRDVRRRAPHMLGDRRVQTRVVDERRLADILDRRSTFAVHVLREAVVVHDAGERFARLRARYPRDAPSHTNPDEIARRLEVYEDLEWCQGLYLYCLADCYAAGRAATFALLGGRCIFEFSAAHAFTRLALDEPRLAPPVRRIARLRPFFVLADRDTAGPLPFPYRDCRPEAEAAIAAAHELIDACR